MVFKGSKALCCVHRCLEEYYTQCCNQCDTCAVARCHQCSPHWGALLFKRYDGDHNKPLIRCSPASIHSDSSLCLNKPAEQAENRLTQQNKCPSLRGLSVSMSNLVTYASRTQPPAARAWHVRKAAQWQIWGTAPFLPDSLSCAPNGHPTWGVLLRHLKRHYGWYPSLLFPFPLLPKACVSYKPNKSFLGMWKKQILFLLYSNRDL